MVEMALPGSPSIQVTIGDAATATAYLEARNRGNLSGTALDAVYSDFIATRDDHLQVTLSGLPAGEYQWTGYHNDSGTDTTPYFSGADLSVEVDGLVVDTLVASAARQETNDWAVGTSLFRFEAVPGEDVVIDFYRSSANAITLNGFKLDLMSVPEPSALALAILGLLGFGLPRRRRGTGGIGD